MRHRGVFLVSLETSAAAWLPQSMRLLSQKRQQITQLGIRERHDESGRHEGHFDFGAADDVGFGEGAFFPGEVSEDFAAGRAQPPRL